MHKFTAVITAIQHFSALFKGNHEVQLRSDGKGGLRERATRTRCSHPQHRTPRNPACPHPHRLPHGAASRQINLTRELAVPSPRGRPPHLRRHYDFSVLRNQRALHALLAASAHDMTKAGRVLKTALQRRLHHQCSRLAPWISRISSALRTVRRRQRRHGSLESTQRRARRRAKRASAPAARCEDGVLIDRPSCAGHFERVFTRTVER